MGEGKHPNANRTWNILGRDNQIAQQRWKTPRGSNNVSRSSSQKTKSYLQTGRRIRGYHFWIEYHSDESNLRLSNSIPAHCFNKAIVGGLGCHHVVKRGGPLRCEYLVREYCCDLVYRGPQWPVYPITIQQLLGSAHHSAYIMV